MSPETTNETDGVASGGRAGGPSATTDDAGEATGGEAGKRSSEQPTADRVGPPRWSLGLTATAAVAVAHALLVNAAWRWPPLTTLPIALSGALVAATGAAGVLLCGRNVLPALPTSSAVVRRLSVSAFGAVAVGLLVVAAAVLSPWLPEPAVRDAAYGIVAAFFLVDWPSLIDPRRGRSLRMGPIVVAGAAAATVSTVVGPYDLGPVLAGGGAAGAALIAQAAAPVDRPAVAATPSEEDADAYPPAEASETPSSAAEASGVVAPSTVSSDSPFLRAPAFLLAMLPFVAVPLAGLHRVYVGKIGTGIVWLLTLGWLYVGQLVDVVLIVSGSFTDTRGRRLSCWLDRDERTVSRTDASPSSAAAPRGTPASRPLTLAGAACLLLATLIMAALAVDVPRMVASGYPVGLSAEMERAFGYPHWPDLLVRLGHLVVWLLAFAAVVFLLVARRRSGPAHMLRAVAGTGALLLAGQGLEEACRRVAHSWPEILTRPPGPALETLLGRVELGLVALAAVLGVAGLVLFIWPAERATEP